MNEANIRYRKLFHKLLQQVELWQSTNQATVDLLFDFVQDVSKWDVMSTRSLGVLQHLPQTVQLIQGTYIKNLERTMNQIRANVAVFEGIIDELRLIQQEGLQYYASVSATLSHWIEKSQTQSSSTITLKKSKKQLDQEKIVSNPMELISSYLFHLQEFYLSFEKEFFERKKILEVDYEQSAEYATLVYQKFTAPYKYIDINMILAVVDTAERSVSNSRIEL